MLLIIKYMFEQTMMDLCNLFRIETGESPGKHAYCVTQFAILSIENAHAHHLDLKDLINNSAQRKARKMSL